MKKSTPYLVIAALGLAATSFASEGLNSADGVKATLQGAKQAAAQASAPAPTAAPAASMPVAVTKELSDILGQIGSLGTESCDYDEDSGTYCSDGYNILSVDDVNRKVSTALKLAGDMIPNGQYDLAIQALKEIENASGETAGDAFYNDAGVFYVQSDVDHLVDMAVEVLQGAEKK